MHQNNSVAQWGWGMTKGGAETVNTVRVKQYQLSALANIYTFRLDTWRSLSKLGF